MGGKVRDMMEDQVIKVGPDDSVRKASRLMLDHNIGDVLVMDGPELTGILTDRDIVIRVLAEGMNVDATMVRDVASKDIASVSPDSDLDEAAKMMRQKAIKRLPVMQDGQVIGILTLGDLASKEEGESALEGISKAMPNR